MGYNDNLSGLEGRVFFDNFHFFRFCPAPHRDRDVCVCSSSCLSFCNPSFSATFVGVKIFCTHRIVILVAPFRIVTSSLVPVGILMPFNMFLLSFVCANSLLLPMKIEPGVGSVVKSMVRDRKLSLSLLFLVSCPAPSRLLARTIGH
jgi:hypothetical protein